MPQKLYSVESLLKFKSNDMIIYRNESDEIIYTYQTIIDNVKYVNSRLQGLNIPLKGCGLIATGHTPGVCVLLLSLLNNNCRFCPIADCNGLNDFLISVGVEYLFADSSSEQLNLNLKLILELNIFNQIFQLYKLTSSSHFERKDLPNDLCYTIATTGTTGKPKAVHVPYRCIEPNISALCVRLCLCSQDIIFLGTPITFDPFVVEFFMALMSGASLLLTTETIRLNPHKLLETLWPCRKAAKNVTVLQTTPSLFRRFNIEAIKNVIFNKSSLRILLLGGEQFPSVAEFKSWMTDDKFVDKAVRVFNIYGITEVSCWSTINEINGREMDRISIGEPLDDATKLRIINRDNNAGNNHEFFLRNDGHGELQIGSSSRKCYIPKIDCLHEVLEENSVVFRNTGDLVERKHGNIYYVGRLHNTVKRIGKILHLDALSEKLENLTKEIEPCSRVVVTWLNDKLQLVFCVIQMQNIMECVRKQLSERFLSHLSDHEKPDKIIYLNEVPLNEHGKLNRHKLLTIINDKIIRDRKPVELFKAFLKDILGISLSIIEDMEEINQPKKCRKCISKDLSTMSFTAAGGTSFHAVSLAAEISTKLTNPLEQKILLEKMLNSNVTIADIIGFLKKVNTLSTLSKADKNIAMLDKKDRRLKITQRFDMQKCVDAAPTICEKQYLCIGSHSHLLLTIDVNKGKEISRITLPDRIECSVTFIPKNHIGLVGCYDGFLYAFDFLNNKIYWQINLGGMIKAKPLLANDFVIIGNYATDFNLSCININTQSVLWRRKIGSKPIFSSPILLTTSRVLVCTLDGTISCIEILNGITSWEQHVESPVFSTPVICMNYKHFLLAEVTGKVHIFDASDGRSNNTFHANGNIFSNLTVLQKDTETSLVLFGCHDQHIYCLKCIKSNTITFNILWKTQMDSPIFATPQVCQCKNVQIVIICTTKGVLAILELFTGALIDSEKVNGEIYSTPCCLEDTNNTNDNSEVIKIFFGCRDNNLYFFTLNNSIKNFTK